MTTDICETTYRFTDRFVSGIMPDLQIGVLKSLFTTDAFGGVEAQHFRQEVDSHGVCMRVKGGEGYPRLDGERPDIVLGLNRHGCQRNVRNI